MNDVSVVSFVKSKFFGQDEGKVTSVHKNEYVGRYGGNSGKVTCIINLRCI